VGPRAGLDRRGKSRPPMGFDHRAVHPVAGRYTHFLSSAEVKNEWSYTSTPTCAFMAWCVVTRTALPLTSVLKNKHVRTEPGL
jgi:hypothetical protein